jgi:hypothetical protein
MHETTFTSVLVVGRTVKNKKQKRHFFLWIFLLAGVHVGLLIHKNNGSVPSAWLAVASRSFLMLPKRLTPGLLTEMESTDFNHQLMTALSGEFC